MFLFLSLQHTVSIFLNNNFLICLHAKTVCFGKVFGMSQFILFSTPTAYTAQVQGGSDELLLARFPLGEASLQSSKAVTNVLMLHQFSVCTTCFHLSLWCCIDYHLCCWHRRLIHTQQSAQQLYVDILVFFSVGQKSCAVVFAKFYAWLFYTEFSVFLLVGIHVRQKSMD